MRKTYSSHSSPQFGIEFYEDCVFKFRWAQENPMTNTKDMQKSNEFRIVCSFFGCDSPLWTRVSSFTRFLDHTQQRTKVARTHMYESSARRRDLYLTRHTQNNIQISMPLMGCEPTISTGELPQTYALDRADTGTGISGDQLLVVNYVGSLGLKHICDV